MEKKVYLTLQNGKVFEGFSFGQEREVIGELVFTTGMTGYLETLTDPSYYGQIVAQTFPLIGNYGLIREDFESARCWLTAYIVREKCDFPSNFRCKGTLEEYLKEQGIPAVYGIDTRELTRIVRETGVMNAAITFQPLKDLTALKSYRVKDAVRAVSGNKLTVTGKENGLHVVLYDFGAKSNIERELVNRGCRVTVVPANYTAEEVLKLDPQGIMLANGPGDPAENKEIIENIKKLIRQKPIFGICLGHQLLALAMGGKTRKMKYGHRGANQPVKQLSTGRVFISSQNHGYEVVSESLPNATLSFINVNDGTCEGLDYPEANAFTVQFHPEACGGPHDANYLFDEFIARMKKEK
ncbi:MAG: carbamoyl phosphate synthase small subunit [Clostridia bacterium]|jgi:carbamoyl-phosphate synthase small subunit|nr:carbamoyl phosphate synthase small subunit [Clostridia bacterium]